MGYLGRRIGKSQDTGTDKGYGAGGGVLDMFSHGYFQRKGEISNPIGSVQPGISATGGITNVYEDGGNLYKAHIFTSSGTFEVDSVGSYGNNVEYLVVAGGGGG